MTKQSRAKVIPFRPRATPPAELSDEALVAACASGDAEALGRLYDRFADSLARFLGRLAYVVEHEIEDLIQEVFLAVFESAPKFRARSTVRTWIFAIAANHARTSARSGSRRRRARERLEAVPGPRARQPDAETMERQLAQAFENALSALPHDQRVAFIMCDIEDVSGIDAASALGIPKGTLYRRLHEARKALRSALEDER